MIRPRGGYLLVEPEAMERVSPGGIHLPDDRTDRRRTFFGRVVAKGTGYEGENGAWLDLSDIPVGARIIYEHGGQYDVPGSKMQLVSAAFVAAVLE